MSETHHVAISLVMQEDTDEVWPDHSVSLQKEDVFNFILKIFNITVDILMLVIFTEEC